MGISVGLVGLGEFGSQFIGLNKAHPDVERLALCDLRRERLVSYAKKYEISETFSSLDVDVIPFHSGSGTRKLVSLVAS